METWTTSRATFLITKWVGITVLNEVIAKKRVTKAFQCVLHWNIPFVFIYSGVFGWRSLKAQFFCAKE